LARQGIRFGFAGRCFRATRWHTGEDAPVAVLLDQRAQTLLAGLVEMTGCRHFLRNQNKLGARCREPGR
jgi:hypothetical protein